MLLRPLRHGHVVFPNPISLPSGKKGSSTGSEKCQGSFLRDVVSGSLQRFFSSRLLFSHNGFCFGLPIPGSERELFCWISSRSDKIWLSWRKSLRDSLSLSPWEKGLAQVQVLFLSLLTFLCYFL